jgi:peptidoglycan/LPS O-acetylase OafA/YrhL
LSGSHPKIHYRPDIDGLRAVAVIPVVLFHAGLPYFSGGYVGVDVFFVISGFLIASIISREIDENRFSIVNFYERRARRILPALFLVIGVTLIAALAISWPQDFVEISESALATIFFGSNIYFWRSIDYFATAAEYKPLLHTWSLAVEEQFYIFFPLFLILMTRKSRQLLIASLALAFVISLGLSINWAENRLAAGFYLAPARAWELLLGVFLALNTVRTWSGRWLREIAAVAGLVLILASIAVFDSTTAFPGLAALVPCLGTVLVIQAGRGEGAPTQVARLLSRKSVVFVGLISYSLYLWHWPIFAFSRFWLGTTHLPLSWALSGAAIAFVLASISWSYVERPFRTKSTISRQGVFRFSAVTALLLSGVSIASIMANGVPARFEQRVLDVLAGAEDTATNRKECMGEKDNDQYCVFGAHSLQPSAILWGDSHAGALMPAVSKVLEIYDRSAYIAWEPACAPMLGIKRIGYFAASSSSCTEFNLSILDFIDRKSDSLDIVFLAARWPLNVTGQRAPGEAGFPVQLAPTVAEGTFDNADLVYLGLGETVKRLTEMGLHVILLGGVPEIGWNVPRQIAHAITHDEELPKPPSMDSVAERHFDANRILADISSEYRNVTVVDLSSLLCTPSCQVLEGTIPVYVDDNHLSKHGAYEVLGPRLVARLGELLQTPLTHDQPIAKSGRDGVSHFLSK